MSLALILVLHMTFPLLFKHYSLHNYYYHSNFFNVLLSVHNLVIYFPSFRHRMTPLMHACQSNHTGLVGVLLSYNADVNRQDSWGWTVRY